MSINGLIFLVRALDKLVEVMDGGDLDELVEYVKGYFPGYYSKEVSSYSQYFELTIEKLFKNYDHKTDIFHFKWGRYYFWEDDNGMYIKDLESWSIIYTKVIESLDDYGILHR